MKVNFCLLTLVFCCLFTFSQTQNDLTKKSAEELKASKMKTEGVYNKILEIYSKDKLFIKNLKASQKKWVD
jgi:hypothetical protein